MKFLCNLTRQPDQGWTAHHEGPDVGIVTVKAASREEALEKMRGELRYRLELSPCTGESYQHIEIELVEES